MHLINAKYNRSDGFSAPDDGRSHAQIDDFCTEIVDFVVKWMMFVLKVVNFMVKSMIFGL